MNQPAASEKTPDIMKVMFAALARNVSAPVVPRAPDARNSFLRSLENTGIPPIASPLLTARASRETPAMIHLYRGGMFFFILETGYFSTSYGA
jgi:hypothetical protein